MSDFNTYTVAAGQEEIHQRKKMQFTIQTADFNSFIPHVLLELKVKDCRKGTTSLLFNVRMIKIMIMVNAVMLSSK